MHITWAAITRMIHRPMREADNAPGRRRINVPGRSYFPLSRASAPWRSGGVWFRTGNALGGADLVAEGPARGLRRGVRRTGGTSFGSQDG